MLTKSKTSIYFGPTYRQDKLCWKSCKMKKTNSNLKIVLKNNSNDFGNICVRIYLVVLYNLVNNPCFRNVLFTRFYIKNIHKIICLQTFKSCVQTSNFILAEFAQNKFWFNIYARGIVWKKCWKPTHICLKKSVSNFYKKSLVRIRYSAKFIALSSGLFGVVQNNFKNLLYLMFYTSSRNTNQILNIKLWIRLTEYPTQSRSSKTALY